jgi:Protein of unknown function (DUF3429)
MNPPSAEPLPRVVFWLGYGGLLPFAALAVGSVFGPASGDASPLWQAALITYGAAILSFVGALHWGFAMTLPDLAAPRRTASFVWSVVPALVAWVALLVTPVVSTGLLVAGFVSHYGRDRALAAHADLPGWYLPMRLRLTLVACLCLAAPVFAPFLKP